jgi:hypothetical protein
MHITTMKRMLRAIPLLLPAALFILLDGCHQKNRFDVNVDDIQLKITVHRFDKDLFAVDTARIDEGIASLSKKYGSYLDMFFTKVMQFDRPEDPRAAGELKAFLKDTAVRHVFGETLRQYANITDIENQLTDAFKRVRFFFPEKKIPQFYFHVSMFNQSLVVDSNVVSLSADNYLGAGYYWYKKLVYEYLRPNMRREKVTSDFVTAFLMTEFPAPYSERFLDNMLYRGKLMFALSVLMPKAPPELLMGYAKEQMAWCREHEKAMWLNIMDNKQLYSTDMMVSTNYLNDAPFTATISQDSPGRAGIWIGWQIISRYMDRNPKVTLPELMADNNYQHILEQSGYKP